MPFIDWNNNGKIDPTDIGIGIALDSDNGKYDYAPEPEPKRKIHHGCLAAALTFVCGIVLLVLVIVMI